MADPDYRLFAAIVEQGSLSAAGRGLGLSAAATSKRLAGLEARLGVRLIHRTTRRLATSAAGQAFYEDVRAILAASDAAEARVTGRADTPVGALRVSAPTSFGRMHVAPHLGAFLEAHPKVRVSLILDDRYVDLVDQRIDVAIRIGPEPQGFAATLLAPNHRLLCAAPAYLDRHGTPVSPAGLKGHRLLAASGQSPWRLEAPGGRRRAIEVESAVPTNSSEVVRELAVSGVGIALRSTWDVAAELRSGALVRILPGWHGASDVGIYAVHARADPLPAATRAYVAHLVQLYRPTPAWA